ncbi:retrotrans_gag domain-containing protein [Trichonephila clavata]|uniref:Retrotrans_gag domain-containing protein n=1 Tax=Trichonephila clavata TaxID=2740835 RepID=A0A8X6FYT8_TRICU|nr:retrotrans_gag domain-containing protein [Trichonephila clavata]
MTDLVEARGINVDNSNSLRLRGLSPEFGLYFRERKRTKMQEESKPIVVTPTYQPRSSSTFRGTLKEDPLKWLEEYDRVAKFNNWDNMM